MSLRSIASPVQQRQHAVDGALHAGRRRALDGAGPALLQARPRGLGGRRGQLEAGDARWHSRRCRRCRSACRKGRTLGRTWPHGPPNRSSRQVGLGVRPPGAGAPARSRPGRDRARGGASARRAGRPAARGRARGRRCGRSCASVDSRWAMAITVRPCISRSSAWRIISSDSLSSDDVASSSSTIGESFRSARATAMRWRWPPDSRVPRSPTMVSRAAGQRLDEVGSAPLRPPP